MLRQLKLSFRLRFFIYPIGASGDDPGRVDFKPRDNPSTTPFFEGGAFTLTKVAGSTGPVLPSWRLQKICFYFLIAGGPIL